MIGKDTRLSGYMLEPALTAGFVSAGMNVMLVGPAADTGAWPSSTRSLRADLGVMISASHNRVPRQRHQALRPRRLQALGRDRGRDRERSWKPDRRRRLGGAADLGRAQRIEDARGRYIENAEEQLPAGA